MDQSISKMRMRITLDRIKGFWDEYKRNKIGLLGLFIILAFIIIAFIAPLIVPYNPNAKGLANPVVMPGWIRVFPQYWDLPLTHRSEVNFTITKSNDFIDVEFKDYDSELCELLDVVSIRDWNLKYHGNNTDLLETKLTWNFTYNYHSPPIIEYDFRWRVTNLSNMGYNLELCLVKWGSETVEYSLWDTKMCKSSPQKSLKYKSDYPYGEWPRLVQKGSDYDDMLRRLVSQIEPVESLTSKSVLKNIFSEKGEYGLVMYIRLKSESANATCDIDLLDPEFSWLGSVHGILGTNHEGADVFSRLIYGVRVSLSIGLIVALMSVSIGTFVGVTCGYTGGFIDEVSMRTVDILLCLPIFPLLLALVLMFGRNLYLIMSLLALLSWMGLSRTVRSQVLSIREMTFVESAIASGGSKAYILVRHILPNVMPLIFTSMMLSIPGAILSEASLSFLGFGDPNVMSWGRMINNAMNFGAFAQHAWWWIFPPAFAIMILSAGFVFVSHALDQILNPRLRMRK